ncbi:MAG TPA: sterol desaturase family protein [Polyangiaceae bacterium]|nr:sterol desaturase family protein [Polyangiaceae bacterium]
MAGIIVYAIPAFLLMLALEALWARRAVREGARVVGEGGRETGARVVGYGGRDTAASLAMGVGYLFLSLGAKVGSLAAMTWLYQHRLFDLPGAWWVWALLVFAEDFCYYWFHRSHHEVRLLWAAHVNHHSSTHYNLSTALRQSWTTPLTSPIFWWPLPLLGFHPAWVITQQAISLLYQFWLHTEAVGSLGPFERVFNTPSHHRVHHGSNPEYLDKNHAGIFILWDKLFGTFAPERAAVTYGLTKNIGSYNPVRIAFHEWADLARDVRRAPSAAEALRHVFGPPGARPEPAALPAEAPAPRVALAGAPGGGTGRGFSRAPMAGEREFARRAQGPGGVRAAWR